MNIISLTLKYMKTLLIILYNLNDEHHEYNFSNSEIYEDFTNIVVNANNFV